MNQTRLGLAAVLASLVLVAWILCGAGLRIYDQLHPANSSPFIIMAAMFYSGLILTLKRLALISVRLVVEHEKKTSKTDRF